MSGVFWRKGLHSRQRSQKRAKQRTTSTAVWFPVYRIKGQERSLSERKGRLCQRGLLNLGILTMHVSVLHVPAAFDDADVGRHWHQTKRKSPQGTRVTCFLFGEKSSETLSGRQSFVGK